MAKRRMLSIELCTSDKFLNLSDEARQLYFYLNLFSDDDGFLGNASTVARLVGIPKTYLDELCGGNYIMKFDSGAYVITHWWIHNQIKKDRHTPTDFIKEIKKLELVNKIYVLKEEKEASEGPIFFGDILEPEISLDERSEDKLREEKERENKISSIEYRQSVFASEKSKNVENSLNNQRSDSNTADKEAEQYSNLIGKIRLYFISNQRLKDAEAFIDYNEKREWIGINGESVKENFPKYAKGWLEKGKEFYEE